MDQQQLQELRELVEFLKSNSVDEFDMERADLKVRIKFAGEPASAQAQPAHFAAPATAQLPLPVIAASSLLESPVAAQGAPVTAVEKLHEVKSPIVGTFYDAPSPGARPFVAPGDIVQAGQVLCIVEAMKLMNEIEADIAGEIVERVAVAGQPVEYGQPLFHIRPR